MTPNEYQKLALRTRPKEYPYLDDMNIPDIVHAQLGISSEAGELADCIKKHLIYQQQLNWDNIAEECGDLLWYIALMLEGCGTTMEYCMEANIEKLKIRYPGKFTEHHAKERLDKK